MQSGRQTLSGIEESLRDLKAQEAEVQRELEAANAERSKLVAERLDALARLASVRAKDAIADGVVDDADNLSQQVRASLAARLRTIEQLKARHAEAEASRLEHIKSQDALTQRIALLEERLDQFAAEARIQLARDPAHAADIEAHQRLATTLEQATAKAEQVARDEHEKGQPYRADPLFMYLWQRGMGTSEYKATGLVRMLDEWVARMVRYSDARANYAMLTEIPVRLRAHAEDMRRKTDAAKAELDAREATRTRELAGADLVDELRRERERQSELAKGLEAITSELAETGAQIKTYAKGEDESFKSAVTAYAAFLEREPLRRLVADAAATRPRDDDRVVEELERLARELESVETGTTQRRRRLDQLSERKIELSRIASNFRRQRYDDVGSEFANSPRTEDLLQLLLRGAITAAEYWIRMQQQQHWRNRPGDPWRRQSGLPPFDGFPGGFGGFGGMGGRRRDDDDDDDRGGRSSRHGFDTGGSF